MKACVARNTEFIDVLWVHAWDSWTPTEEIMKGLEDLSVGEWCTYIGVSDTPALGSQSGEFTMATAWLVPVRRSLRLNTV